MYRGIFTSLTNFIKHSYIYLMCHKSTAISSFMQGHFKSTHSVRVWMFLDQRHFANTGINQWERSGWFTDWEQYRRPRRAENITSLQTEISEQRPLWANVDSPTEPRHVALCAITSCQLDKHRPINQNCTPALLSESSRERTRVTFFGVVAIASGRCNKSIKTMPLIDVAISWAPL